MLLCSETVELRALRRATLTRTTDYLPTLFCYVHFVYSPTLFFWAILQQGVRFDPDMPQTIRLEFAKSNTKVSKPKQQAANAANTHPTLMHPLTGRKYTPAYRRTGNARGLKTAVLFRHAMSLHPSIPHTSPTLPFTGFTPVGLDLDLDRRRRFVSM